MRLDQKGSSAGREVLGMSMGSLQNSCDLPVHISCKYRLSEIFKENQEVLNVAFLMALGLHK